MKNYKILALAACLLTLAACDKEKETVLPGGLDASKPAVSSFSYDEANSGETAAAFTWDATAAGYGCKRYRSGWPYRQSG